MTTNSISYNRTLFLEDNLPVLRGLDSDSVDLIATDPPFNKGVPAFKGTTKAGKSVEFKDVWTGTTTSTTIGSSRFGRSIPSCTTRFSTRTSRRAMTWARSYASWPFGFSRCTGC